jgi:hypothetical protein
MFDINECSVFFTAFISENFDFILQNLDTFLHLSKVLGGVLDLRDVLVTGVLHFFVKSDERIQTELSFLLFLSKIENKQFLDLKFLLGLSGLSHSLRGSPGHLLSDGRQELDLLHPLVLLLLKSLHLLLVSHDVRTDLHDLSLHILLFQALLHQLTHKYLLFFF